MPKTNAALSQIGTFSTSILLPNGVVGLLGGLWGLWEFGAEVIQSVLASANIAEEVEVVVQEVCEMLELIGMALAITYKVA